MYADRYTETFHGRTRGPRRPSRTLIACAHALALFVALFVALFRTPPHPCTRKFGPRAAGLVVFTLLATYLFKLRALTLENP